MGKKNGRLRGIFKVNRDKVQQKHFARQPRVVFLEREECFPNTKVGICQITSGQLQKNCPFLLIAGADLQL